MHVVSTSRSPLAMPMISSFLHQGGMTHLELRSSTSFAANSGWALRYPMSLQIPPFQSLAELDYVYKGNKSNEKAFFSEYVSAFRTAKLSLVVRCRASQVGLG